MPFRPEHSLLSLEVPAMKSIDTTSAENLFGMWSLFSKTSHVIENGRRLENLSWRLWNRETFCCAHEPRPETTPECCSSVPAPRRPHPAHPHPKCRSKAAATPRDTAVPALSTSPDSISSGDEHLQRTPQSNCIPKARPELRRNESAASTHSRGSAKHMTPIDLEKMVISISETNLEPIELPIPTPSPPAKAPPSTSMSQVLSMLHLTCSPSPPSQDQTRRTSDRDSQATLLESSASTVATNGSGGSSTSHPVGSQESSSTEISSHSIISSFVPGGAPSYRSHTNLSSQPTTILKTSPQFRPAPPKKKAVFTIGTSSGEDESSLDSHMYRNVLADSLRNQGGLRSDSRKKQTSFQDEVAVSKAAAVRHSPVFESDEEDEEVSESAIEEDDDSSDWEDSDDGSGPSSVNDKDLFQRVDSRPNLRSQRSLLTTLMHEPDRAKALANAASRSTPAIRRSRTTSPNGPSVAASPEVSSQSPLAPWAQREYPRSKPIIMTTSNTHQNLALSPRTTRRNMLSTELTESLRKNLLWERQHKSTGNLAALKRRHTSTDVKALRQHPEPGPVLSRTDGPKTFSNDYFHAGLGEYHAKGW